MNLLVTGGAGFIGSHFVLRHKEQSPDDLIVVLDKLTYAGRKEYLNPILDRIRFIQEDLVNVELLTKLIEKYGIDAIVNFAAETHVDRSITSTVPFLHTNVLGVQSLIEACKAHSSVRLLHISTDEVYGDVADDDPPRKIEDPLRPSSPYAASKACSEMLLMAAARTYGLQVAISRCTNNYGPHQAEEKFIPTVIRTALKSDPVPIYAKGENKRDWLYVSDHCDALELMLQAPDVFSGCRFFNIAAGNEQRNIDVAKMVLRILGKPAGLLTFVPDRPGHDWRYAIDPSSVRELGWKPQVSFEEGLRRTVEWYRERARA